jgi:hypothetical protein
VNAVTGLVERLDGQVDFGLALFPDYERERTVDPLAACTTGGTLIEPMPNASDAISDVLDRTVPAGNTPTASTLATIAGAGIADPDGRQTLLLLVTDGAPNCSAEPVSACTCTTSTSSCQPEHCLDNSAVDQVRSLAGSGVQTYVIGFRTSRWQEVLDAMAAAGGTGRDMHFPVENESELDAAFAEITGGVLSCSYELDSVPEDIQYVRVVVDGAEAQHESVMSGDGWRLVGDRTVEIIGPTCDALRDTSSGHTVEISVECDPVFLI